MIRVLSDGSDGHRIESDEGVAIGSIRNGAVRLAGFGSDGEALDAVHALWSALDGTLVRQYTGWQRYEPAGALRVDQYAGHEWATDGRRPLARLVRGTGGVSLEFVLPSYATDGVLITAASALAMALVRHREAPATPALVLHRSADTSGGRAPRPRATTLGTGGAA